MRTAIGYVRVSTARQELSPEAQKQKIEQFAGYQDLELQAIFEDLAVSGRSTFSERPGGSAALEALKGVDAIVIAKLSRAFRNAEDALQQVRKLVAAGKDVFFLDLGMNVRTPTGKMVMGLLAVMAEWEADIIGERTREALAVAKTRGTKIGQAPFGYKSDLQGGHMINLKEWQTLEEIRSWAQTGVSFSAIAQQLNHDGKRTRDGKDWTHVQIARILRREAATG